MYFIVFFFIFTYITMYYFNYIITPLNQSFVRNFSTTLPKLINIDDGRQLDANEEVERQHAHSKESLEQYFEEKRQSIIDAHRVDSNLGAIDGFTASELQKYMDQKNELLVDLEGQFNDFKINTGWWDSSSDSESEESKYNTNNNNTDKDNTNKDNTNNDNTDNNNTDNDNANKSNTNNENTGGSGSLLDDYADTSEHMPSYMDPED